MTPYKYPADGYITVLQLARKYNLSETRMAERFRNGEFEGCYFKDQRGYKNVDEAKADAVMAQPSIRAQHNRKTLEENAPDNSTDEKHAYTRARTGREIISYQLAQLELEEKKGSLVSAEEVRKEQFIIGRQIRDQFIAIPDRISAILAAEPNDKKCHRILLDQIRRCLDNVDKYMRGEL